MPENSPANRPPKPSPLGDRTPGKHSRGPFPKSLPSWKPERPGNSPANRPHSLPPWGRLLPHSPSKAFPLGGPNARKTVQWTVFSEVGPAGPRNGGFRRNCLQFCRKTNEVVCQASPLSHLHHLFYPPPITTQSCRGFPADCRQVKPFFVSITYLVRVRPHPSALRAATFPKGEGCCRTVLPKPSPLGDRTPGKQSSGLFLVRSGRQAHGMVDFGGIACNSVERRMRSFARQAHYLTCIICSIRHL